MAKRDPEASDPLPPLIIVTTPAFDPDAKRQAKKRGNRMEKLYAAVQLLCNRESLPAGHRDHALKGDWAGFREFHVGGEGDWLLVYRRSHNELELVRTGTHDEIFQ